MLVKGTLRVYAKGWLSISDKDKYLYGQFSRERQFTRYGDDIPQFPL